MRNVAHGLPSIGIYINGLRLRRADCLKRLDLSIVESRRFAVCLQTHRLVVHTVQLRQGANGVVPHFSPLCRRHAWDRRVTDDPPIEEFHDIKRRPYDTIIHTQAVHLRDHNVGVPQSVQDAVLTLDLVCRLRDQLSWWLLAHHIFAAGGGGNLVGGVGLAKAELEGKSGWDLLGGARKK